MEMIEMLRGIYRADQMRTDEPMAAHTTMRVGGTVDHFVCPEEPDQLIQTLQLGIPCLVLGNGSNLIVRDGGLRGVAISTAGLNQIHVDGVHIRAQAGVTLPALAQEALRRKLSGLEFASGIPGSVGGAVCMNAGAYGGSIQDVIVGAWVLLDGETVYLPREELHMGYRTSRVLKQKGIVLEAEFALTAGDPDAIKAMMDDLNGRRRDKQPLNLPSS
ncbi:FAD-binding protein, partial [Eubacteriales bacterium OttesenSCG-928-N13]|nr:FAD-binding protein [Eubacteriales bacterium OttesenSCG-928-N13]